MKQHPNVKRTWTLIIPTETMPAVNSPKGMNQFMRELSDVVIDFAPDAFVGLTGDFMRKECKVTFKYYKTAVGFANVWFKSRAAVLAELARDRKYNDLDDVPF